MTALGKFDLRLEGAAFRRLYAGGRPAAVEEVASDAGLAHDDARATVNEMLAQGRIRVDGDGRVVGACGLSVVPDRHELWVGERRFWTWCAMDAVGILGALAASGLVRSRSPRSGAVVEIRFTAGRPEPTPAVIFMAERTGCVSVYDDWCSKLNLFEDAAAAAAWIESSGATGQPVPVPELTESVSARWRVLVEEAG